MSLRIYLEEAIQARHLLSHSFYTRWSAGQLSQAELQGYAKEYYAFEKEFPRFLSAIHSHTSDPEIRVTIAENLAHEEQGTENHPELWLRFAESLGVDRDSVKTHFHSDETENLLRVFRRHSSSENPIDGLAAVYAYERQQPDVARQKKEGLKTFYGLNDERSVGFFTAHQHYDVVHSENEMRGLEKLCDTADAKARALTATKESLEAWHEFLTGVEKRYGAPGMTHAAC